MSLPLVVLVTMAYSWTSMEQFGVGNWKVGLMFLGYAIANIGVIGVLE